jgi:beta-lactamase class A
MSRADLRLPRRDLLRATISVLVAACASQAPPPSATARGAQQDANGEVARVEASVGGRVGVFALDTASGRTVAHRADERFAMCSTFKWTLAAAAFARIDRGEGTLEERIPFGPADLMEVAPVAKEHVGEGAMTVETLARAAVTVSDNTAANLLLAWVGGPAALTAFFRQLGDTVTRLDRNEPSLNTNDPGDVRDTTSPRAMVGLLKAALLGGALKPASRERLRALLQACETGKRRLRAGLPADWVVGDKTGTGENGAFNDVAIAIPPGRAPILMAVYMSDPGGRDDEDGARHEAGHVAIARLVARELVG